MAHKHNWDKIVETALELASGCSTWRELIDAINARLSSNIPETTFNTGIRRELERDFTSYAAFIAYAAGSEDKLDQFVQEVLDRLRTSGRDKPQSLLDLCEHFDRSPSSIMDAVRTLQEFDYNIHITDDTKNISLPTDVPPTGKSIPLWPWLEGNVYRFGVISDTHLCNRNSRLDVLEALYDIYEREGIKVVLLAGNLVDGEFRYNRQELLATGVEGQIMYVANHYPQRDGIVTKFISADDHEGWWTKTIGFDVGRYMDSSFKRLGRTDLQWIGHMEVDLPLHQDNADAILKISHPGGGTAYAASYKAQKAVESLQGGEKPSVWIIGHYHKYVAFYPRSVYVLQPGCVEDQTMFMRKRHIGAHVGGCTLEVHMTTYGGVGSITHTWFPFYDRGYYSDWDYRSVCAD